ncbi:MAG: DUF1549 domain-containing protein [Gemmataceae bacterium]|nr:DUF1549 domain-containing protein [Gemmataceae bacterium]MBJ7344360.1 DUF1549 domain-containing protein [Gemmataceae bacterium]MBJ7430616.1 DUF1549 domain-containing protein [Gemmataceae bacterium]MBJ7494945.1 DUF1549 domain-containing protein [Gemmataceae bacterium]
MKISVLSSACAILLFASATSIQAIAPVSIAVFPPDVNMQSARGKQRIIVQASYADGITRDVTAQAKVTISDPKIAKIVNLEVLPVGDGKCSIAVEFEGKTTQVPVDVKDAIKDRPISFKLDVMPIFLRNGCNQGGCHGAARGKDGFRLSLFGFDPDGDHYRLTRELNGRRINLAIPEESLLVEKSTGKVPHTGGQKFAVGEQYYNDLVRWVDAGGPQDPAGIATPVSVDLFPKTALLDGKGSTQQLIVRAKYSDGSERDVTSLALFLSSNDSSGKVSPSGLVTAGDRGEAFVMARFSTFTVGVPFIVLPKDLKFSFPATPEKNYIDTLVNAKLKNLRIAPSATCSDEVFLRRIFIDLTGMLPSVEEYKTFIANKSADKREQLVKELMERKEFSELWVLKWAELLQIRSSNQVSYKATLLYYNWLQDRIARNVPLNQWVQELLGANGGTFNNPVTNYYQNETDILKVTENVAQVFMGMRIQCAQCHNHPFDRWTMDDYYGFAAFFTQIGRKGTDDPRELVVFNSGSGEINHPLGGRRMAPKYLGGEVPDVVGKDRRGLMAEWLASPKNPYFATNLSNMVWTHFFGVGIINEVDDVRVSNPPSNSELLQELGKKFTEYNYDFKRLVKDIVLSNSYQLSTQANASNESDTKNFSHSSIRRIKAETFLDCISQVTETKNKFPGLPLGARAVQIADGQVSNYFLTTFGRATRESVCSCEVKLDPTLSQSLHLLNGDATTQRITQGNLIGKLLTDKKTPEEILNEIYVRCLSRMPSADEKTKVLALVNAEKDKKQVLEDAFWAVLNTREYMFNH